MNVKELLDIVEGKLQCGDVNTVFENISTDTRTLEPNALFIALKGKKTNGNRYIDEAITKGCQVIITEEEIVKDIPVIKVMDCYQTLFLLGRHLRTKYKIPLIAVTGSVGKTMTKELISSILEKRYNVLKSIKSYNNHIGLPETLFKLNETYQVVVCELGMNHLNEISNLSKMCLPDVSVITKIGTSHIGNLGSKQNILKAKTEIIDGMNNGPLVINGDDKLLKKIQYFNIIKCGLNKRNDLIAYNINPTFDKTDFKIKLDNEIHDFTFNIPGEHLLTNVLLAIQVGLLFNINIKDIKKAVSQFVNEDQRMKVVKLKNHNLLIDDCYNASYESIIGGIETIKKSPLIKVIILGDILELGQYSHKIHSKIINQIKKIADSFIFLVGKNYASLKIKSNKIKHFETKEALISFLDDIKFNYTLFYVKGSRGMQLETVAEHIKKQINEQ